MSALRSEADVAEARDHGRFGPKAEIESDFARAWMSCIVRGLRVRRVQASTFFACRKRSGRDTLRVVALEEHYTVPGIVSRIDPAVVRRRGFPAPDVVWAQVIKRNELANLGEARLADMDASGITVQVLSVAGPGADVVPGAEGIALARDYNNALFEATSRHPDRYQGFAHLPMLSPDAAADELERTVKDLGFCGLLVNGATDGRFLDDPMFEPILARAEVLRVPIYIHPGIPCEKVREAHFDALPGNFSFTLAVSS